MKTSLPNRSVPLALLLLLGAAFGVMLSQLGFYWDDWPVILTGRLLGPGGYWSFYQYDRPISAWTYVLTFPLLGSSPLPWHIFTLLLRWASSVAVWWVFTRLWPGHARQAAWAALLFAVYPVFTQQPIAVAYSQHWICYLLYLVSLGAMLQAHRAPRFRLSLTIIALAASLVQLLTMEYFAGLELLRPLLLWIVMSAQPSSLRQQFTRVLRGWLPYLLVLVGFVVWRLFFLDFPGEEANPPILLTRLLAEPLQAGLRFLQIAMQDTLHLLVAVWARSVSPSAIQLQDRSILFSWALALLAAVAVAFYLARLDSRAQPDAAQESRFRRQALLVGIVAVLLGTLPVWFTDRQMIVGAYSDRFGLPAMFGASLLFTALIHTSISGKTKQVALIGLLVALALGAHVRTANDYRWSWIKQARFYWQLSWRAPQIKPGTAIFSDGEIFPSVGLYSTSAGINLLYPGAPASDALRYWFFSLGREFAHIMPEFNAGYPLVVSFRNYNFNGHTREGIVIHYEPEDNDCLHVLTPEDAQAPGLPAITVQALQNTDLSRILPDSTGAPPESVFGPEPDRGWCYLYQKADLARQQGDWLQVVELGEQAREAGFSMVNSQSNTPLEWVPFIEGYAMTGNWEEARSITDAALQKDPLIQARLCSLWTKLQAAPPASSPGVSAAAMLSALGCPR